MDKYDTKRLVELMKSAPSSHKPAREFMVEYMEWENKVRAFMLAVVPTPISITPVPSPNMCHNCRHRPKAEDIKLCAHCDMRQEMGNAGAWHGGHGTGLKDILS